MKLSRSILPTAVAIAALALGAVSATPTLAEMKEKTVTVGGAPMYPSKNIIQNAVNSKDHTTLVAAVKAAGLVETLQGPGPFTVFAPTNAAFAALPSGTVDTLLQPENKPALARVLTYHVVPGRLDAAALERAITAGHGTATLKTASGGTLWAMKNGDRNIVLRDTGGSVASISTYDVHQANGVIHVIDRVLLPGSATSRVSAPQAP
jgi:uncharacterized surface protein with fasciclin (FAS1) repeats